MANTYFGDAEKLWKWGMEEIGLVIPTPELMLTCYQLAPEEKTSVKL